MAPHEPPDSRSVMRGLIRCRWSQNAYEKHGKDLPFGTRSEHGVVPVVLEKTMPFGVRQFLTVSMSVIVLFWLCWLALPALLASFCLRCVLWVVVVVPGGPMYMPGGLCVCFCLQYQALVCTVESVSTLYLRRKLLYDEHDCSRPTATSCKIR